MNFTNVPQKHLFVAIELSQILAKYSCTYSEAENILDMLMEHYKQTREELEYNTIEDYFNGQKVYNCNNDIVSPLNHIEGFC